MMNELQVVNVQNLCQNILLALASYKHFAVLQQAWLQYDDEESSYRNSWRNPWPVVPMQAYQVFNCTRERNDAFVKSRSSDGEAHERHQIIQCARNEMVGDAAGRDNRTSVKMKGDVLSDFGGFLVGKPGIASHRRQSTRGLCLDVDM
jgi:hypothetical protein